MKKVIYFIFAIVMAFTFILGFTSCDPKHEPLTPEQSIITNTVVCSLVSQNYEIEYPDSVVNISFGDSSWYYTFYPCDYKFPNDMTYHSAFEPSIINRYADEFYEDYCKYTMHTRNDSLYSAGYIKYYEGEDSTYTSFQGRKVDGTIDFLIRPLEFYTDSKTGKKMFKMYYETTFGEEGYYCMITQYYEVGKKKAY